MLATSARRCRPANGYPSREARRRETHDSSLARHSSHDDRGTEQHDTDDRLGDAGVVSIERLRAAHSAAEMQDRCDGEGGGVKQQPDCLPVGRLGGDLDCGLAEQLGVVAR